MKMEFYSGSLESISHWLNSQANRVIDNHRFAGSTIQHFPQGLLAQSLFLTKEEQESGRYDSFVSTEDDEDDDDSIFS